MLLKGIPLVGLLTKQEGRPKGIHCRQVGWPVYMRKNRGEHLILANLVVKQVHQTRDVSPVLNVLLDRSQSILILGRRRKQYGIDDVHDSVGGRCCSQNCRTIDGILPIF